MSTVTKPEKPRETLMSAVTNPEKPSERRS